MTGAKKFNVSHDLTMPLLGASCSPWARTCYDQPIYQI